MFEHQKHTEETGGLAPSVSMFAKALHDGELVPGCEILALSSYSDALCKYPVRKDTLPYLRSGKSVEVPDADYACLLAAVGAICEEDLREGVAVLLPAFKLESNTAFHEAFNAFESVFDMSSPYIASPVRQNNLDWGIWNSRLQHSYTGPIREETKALLAGEHVVLNCKYSYQDMIAYDNSPGTMVAIGTDGVFRIMKVMCSFLGLAIPPICDFSWFSDRDSKDWRWSYCGAGTLCWRDDIKDAIGTENMRNIVNAFRITIDAAMRAGVALASMGDDGGIEDFLEASGIEHAYSAYLAGVPISDILA